jgi:nucleotide-binding universal stress UspA family protein
MSYAAILVHVKAGGEAQSRLQCARGLADRFGAVLIGLGAEMIPPLATAPGADIIQSDLYSAVAGAIEDGLKVAESKFRAAATGLAKEAVWTQGLDFPARAIAAAARGADLIVTDHDSSGPGRDYRDAGAAELAIVSGRPVLVAPEQARPIEAKRIVLAWKDTREARRAMADAMPFFEWAEAVLVLEVCRKDDQAGAEARTEDVARALKRHGVNAEAKAAPCGYANALDILRGASEFGADLVVAGAYGHTRVGEWLFGGVTEELLEQKSHYLLLSH